MSLLSQRHQILLMVRFLVISNTNLLKSSSTLSATRYCKRAIYDVGETQIYICRFLFSHLFDVAKVAKVRGTPASGKSSLAYLLRRHIEDHYPLQDVSLLLGYRAEPSGGSLLNHRQWLETRGWNFPPGGVLIIDEAQLSYWDQELWLDLKSISPDTPYMIILFASYGSASRNLLSQTTPFKVHEEQLVGLSRGPRSSIGLLLTEEETKGVMEKKFPDHQFDESLLTTIYRLTSGHVGAYCDALAVIKKHGVSLQPANLEYE